MSMIIIDSIDQFGEGQHVNWPEQEERKRYMDWYNMRYSSLYTNKPDISNGRQLLDDSEDLLLLPLFKIASDFYNNAGMAEEPVISSDTDTGTRWIQENEGRLLKALRRGTKYWSIQDYAVFVAENDFIRAIDPTYYFRVGLPDQKDALVGHIIAYPWREKSIEELKTQTFDGVPDRITVIKLYNNDNGDRISTHQEFHYDGQVIGAPTTAETESAVTAVCVAGLGDSWYGDVQHLAGRIMIQQSLILDDINRYRNQVRYLPASVLQIVRNALKVGEELPDFKMIQEFINKQKRLTVGLGSDDPQPDASYKEVLDLESAFRSLETDYDLFYITSGLPPTSYGIGVGRGESGYAREKAQDAASARVRAYRSDLAECLPELMVASGAPVSGLYTVNWSSPPFEDRNSKRESVIQELQAGIITPEEAREALGYQREKPETSVAEEPAPEE